MDRIHPETTFHSRLTIPQQAGAGAGVADKQVQVNALMLMPALHLLPLIAPSVAGASATIQPTMPVANQVQATQALLAASTMLISSQIRSNNGENS